MILIHLFIASGIVSKKLGFVRSCRMALGDLLVWGMIKSKMSPLRPLLWLVGAQRVIVKSQL